MAGHKKVAMADLRSFAAKLGFQGAQTLLQSGNLVIRSDRRPADIERLLESEAAKRLGLETEFFARTSGELAEVIARNPFPEAAEKDPSHLVVVFLKDAPDAGRVRALRAAVVGPELLIAWGRQLYVTYPAGIGDSKLTAAVIDRHLGTRGTARNWNSVRKLAALAGAGGAAPRSGAPPP